jgi:thiamine kinase-like enzyme
VGGRRGDDLAEILDQLESLLGPVTAEPELLRGGITNHNYRVGFGQRSCVLRIAGKDTSLLGINRAAERAANRAAAALGLAPEVLAADERWLVTEYVDALPGEPAIVREMPEAVGRALRAVHDSGVELPTRFWVPELLDAYAGVVHARGGELPPAYASARGLAARIAQLLPLTEPVPCHDDLLPGNVMRMRNTNGVMLVDWEYAGMGHRMFDLGNVAVNNEFGEAEEMRLLGAYLERPPSEGDRAALALMRIMSDAREAAWGVIQGVISELDFDFEAYATQHFGRLAAAAEDPRLEEWFVAAAA